MEVVIGLTQVYVRSLLVVGDFSTSWKLLYLMIDHRYTEKELVEEGFDPAFIAKIAARVVGNQFKRLPPVIAKLSRRSINHDFRYLRDWRK